MDWKAIDATIEELSLLKHPFYQAWSAGRLTQDDLRTYSKEYYHLEKNFPRLVSRVHSITADPEVRLSLVENLADEEIGPENHRELWLRFAEGLGLSRAEVTGSEPSAATRAAFDALFALCSADPVTGLAALNAYESQLPKVSDSKIAGLKAFYGFSEPRALGFFEVHRLADVWHSENARKAVDAAGGDQARVDAATRAACAALLSFLDGVDADTRQKREGATACAAC
ncbi:MAG: CADD family putative folate metabolism protein [Elusimicrobia bacterium]|nr:CADD family putative folate metabolism protein [Elusimicrobiota bacterium]